MTQQPEPIEPTTLDQCRADYESAAETRTRLDQQWADERDQLWDQPTGDSND
jgi:hypothetical protein